MNRDREGNFQMGDNGDGGNDHVRRSNGSPPPINGQESVELEQAVLIRTSQESTRDESTDQTAPSYDSRQGKRLGLILM